MLKDLKLKTEKFQRKIEIGNLKQKILASFFAYRISFKCQVLEPQYW